MSVQPHASHFQAYEPLSAMGRASPLDSPGLLAAVPAAGDKHPCPAIGFLIAGAFGGMIWALLALLLI